MFHDFFLKKNARHIRVCSNVGCLTCFGANLPCSCGNYTKFLNFPSAIKCLYMHAIDISQQQFRNIAEDHTNVWALLNKRLCDIDINYVNKRLFFSVAKNIFRLCKIIKWSMRVFRWPGSSINRNQCKSTTF